jgi:hypothetical protein
LYRLAETFKGHPAIGKMEELKLLERLLSEQCEITQEASQPRDDADDRGDGPAPVKLKDRKDIQGNTLHTPHDPDVTYSGHKGKGFGVQISET